MYSSTLERKNLQAFCLYQIFFSGIQRSEKFPLNFFAFLQIFLDNFGRLIVLFKIKIFYQQKMWFVNYLVQLSGFNFF